MSYIINSGSVGYNPYRWCIVPECKNSSVKTPEKLWITVPTDKDLRRTWLNLASSDPKTLLISKSHVYFCEDHFDLENDMENYKQLKTLDSAKRIRMKPNCVPTRFDCQTNRGASTPSDLNEPQFEPNKQPVSQSHEQPKMSNLLISLSGEYDLSEGFTEKASNPTLFCICCLEREVPFIKLLTCSHADFLNDFMIPEIKPQNQIICYQCHEKLKIIKLFKLQVEESFKLLSDSTENTPNSRNQRHNLKIRQVFNIDIPQTNNNIENPQAILEEANTDLDDIIKEEIDIFDNTEKSLPTNSLQTKKMKNIQEAMRIINSNQNSDCISFLATSLQSLSHTLLSDIYTNFDLGSQKDKNPTEMLINVNTAPSADNIATANSTENVTNNLLNSTEHSEIINEEIDGILIEKADVVEYFAKEELNQSVTDINETMDISESHNMQTDETPIDKLGKKPSLGSNIKQLTLTRDQLMQEREKIANSQSYLRAPHRCESCLIGFQFQENLEDHVKRKHTSGKRQTVECDVCLQYVDYSARDMHLFWHHTRYECVACADKFATYDKAAVHYRENHHNFRSSEFFKCPRCPYMTGRKSCFTDHLNAYTKCKLCGIMLGCATGIKLKKHMRICAGAKLKTAKLKTGSKRSNRKLHQQPGQSGKTCSGLF